MCPLQKSTSTIHPAMWPSPSLSVQLCLGLATLRIWRLWSILGMVRDPASSWVRSTSASMTATGDAQACMKLACSS